MATQTATSSKISIKWEGAEQWLRENGADLFTIAATSVYPVSEWNPGGSRMFEDGEQEARRLCSWRDQVQALQLLADQVGRVNPETGLGLFVGCIKHPQELLDPCAWDAEVVDSYFQLVYRKEVIYG